MFAAQLLVAATPVVDLDGTLFVQAGLFIGLFLVLRPLLFEPWLRTQARREEAIQGAFRLSKELQAKAESVGADYDMKLRSARDSADADRATARRSKEEEAQALLGKAREDGVASLDQARAKLDSQGEQARAALSSRIDDLASDIAKRILGRAL